MLIVIYGQVFICHLFPVQMRIYLFDPLVLVVEGLIFDILHQAILIDSYQHTNSFHNLV